MHLPCAGTGGRGWELSGPRGRDGTCMNGTDDPFGMTDKKISKK